MKKRILSILLTVCMIMAMMPVMALAADSPTVTIGTTTLVDGTYYTVKTGDDPTSALVDASDSQPTEGTSYLYYSSDVLSVTGDVSLASGGPSVLGISGGTLTINGSGSLTLTGNGAPAVYAKASTDALMLSGSLDFTVNQTNNSSAVNGNLTVTRAQNVTVTNTSYAPTINGNANISASGDVTIRSERFISVNGNLTVTNAQNVTVTNTSDAPTINGNANISASGDVRIENTGEGPALKGALTVTDAQNVTVMGGGNAATVSDNAEISASGDVTIRSERFISVNGNLTVTGAQNVTVTNTSGTPTINGNADISASGDVKVQNDGNGQAITNNATIHSSDGNITVSGKGSIPVIGSDRTSAVTIQAYGNVLVQRTEDPSTDAPVINFKNPTLTSQTGTVFVSGSTGFMITPKDGEISTYAAGGDVSNTGLDLSSSSLTEATAYVAGDGYVLWEPTVESETVTGGKLTLHNATMEVNEHKALITLPTVDVTVKLEGENSLTNHVDANDIIAIIKQGGTVVINKDDPVKQTPQDYTLTFSGDGTLETETNSKIPISTDGKLIIASSGNIDTDNVYAVDFVMESGYLEGNLASAGDTVVKGGTVYSEKAGICQGDFSMTGGTANYHSLDSYGLVCFGTVTYTGGTLNASVLTVDVANSIITNTIYGDYALSNETMQAGTSQYFTKYILRISSDSRWTIESDSKVSTTGNASGLVMSEVTADNIGEYIINNGALVNNGIILLPNGLTDAEVKTIAENVLKSPSGNGTIQVYDGEDGTNNTVYNNSGQRVISISGDLDLTSGDHSGATLGNDGYAWTGNSTDGYTLTLGNVYLEGHLTLPDNSPVEIHTTADSVINGAILGDGSYFINFTFTGTAPLTINGDISNFVNGDTVTVQDGAQVTVNGLISIGDSGTGGMLVVTGKGTNLSIPSTGAYAIGCDSVRVEGGATLNVSAEDYSIHTLDGGVSVTGGSTLTVGCDYGVYIEDGTFTVDDSSTFTADAAVAAVCVVDRSKTKSQSETLNVSSTLLPSGTEIASAIGETSGYGNTYWSIVTNGNTLSATNENSTPVTLMGAIGALTLEKASIPSSHHSSGGSSTTYYTITATAGENGSISTSGKVSVVENSDKSFTITPDSGYVVSDVLVDGVSVGAVTSYTFENVAKNHTITASFVKSVEQPETTTYDDVKDSDWFKDAVDYVTNEGLMSGMGNDEFGPYINTDRGMIVTILWRLEGQPEASGDASFLDVTDGKYYAHAVNWAAENDIVKGYGNGNFGPTDTITREQMAAILYRYSQFKEYDTTQGGMAVREFSDYDMISAWALESVTWSVNAQLMSGKDNNVIDARGKATRAEVATILMHFCKNVTK